MNEEKRARNYAREYELRKIKVKRIHADIERGKVDDFKKLLETRGVTFSKWLESQIDNELK